MPTEERLILWMAQAIAVVENGDDDRWEEFIPTAEAAFGTIAALGLVLVDAAEVERLRAKAFPSHFSAPSTPPEAV